MFNLGAFCLSLFTATSNHPAKIRPANFSATVCICRPQGTVFAEQFTVDYTPKSVRHFRDGRPYVVSTSVEMSGEMQSRQLINPGTWIISTDRHFHYPLCDKRFHDKFLPTDEPNHYIWKQKIWAFCNTGRYDLRLVVEGERVKWPSGSYLCTMLPTNIFQRGSKCWEVISAEQFFQRYTITVAEENCNPKTVDKFLNLSLRCS